jgi:hypothetical protein
VAAKAAACGKQQLSRLPDPMNGELWQWQARDLAQAIRKREISSREVVKSCLSRLEQVNPRVNAVVDVLADEALIAADRADVQSLSARARARAQEIVITAGLSDRAKSAWLTSSTSPTERTMTS